MIKLILATSVLLLAACIHKPIQENTCSNSDGALTNKGFVIVTSPVPGERVSSGFEVKGCSVTFEATVPWVLEDLEGNVIASGHTMGGNLGIPAPFSFIVDYTIDKQQFGKLRVLEDDPSDGEGFPPIDNIFPVILEK